jgi:hypothetical protein
MCYLALWEPQIWTYSLVFCTSVTWLKSKICMHYMAGVVQGPYFIWQMYITFRHFPAALLRSYESESTGSDKRYLSNKTRTLYLTTCMQFIMLCFKQYRFLHYQFCHSIDGQAEKQYLRSKLTESVELLTGIQNLSESILDKDNDCPDRLPVIILSPDKYLHINLNVTTTAFFHVPPNSVLTLILPCHSVHSSATGGLVE